MAPSFMSPGLMARTCASQVKNNRAGEGGREGGRDTKRSRERERMFWSPLHCWFDCQADRLRTKKHILQMQNQNLHLCGPSRRLDLPFLVKSGRSFVPLRVCGPLRNDWLRLRPVGLACKFGVVHSGHNQQVHGLPNGSWSNSTK